MGNATETWTNRELPILRAALRRADAGELMIDLAELRQELGIDADQMRVALRALEQAGYLPNPTGNPYDGRNMVRDVFEPARRKAKLPAVRFHDLRHSYASVLIAQGAHPKVISDQLGHASVQITMDRYSHLFDHAYSDVSDELEKAWTATETAAETMTTAVVSR